MKIVLTMLNWTNAVFVALAFVNVTHDGLKEAVVFGLLAGMATHVRVLVQHHYGDRP